MRRKPVTLRLRADADIDAAIDFYLREAPDQAEALLEALEATFLRVGKSPGAGSPRYAHALDLPGLRHLRTPRFPYLVFYFETERSVEVVRVLHERRDLPPELDED